MIKAKILSLLDRHRIMTLATLRPDGWPQATTVGYVNDGLTLYFLCGLHSQKAANIAHDNRVSLTIDHDADQVMEITGLSMAARAQAVTDQREAERVLSLLPTKYPPQRAMPGPLSNPIRCASLASVLLSSRYWTTRWALDTPISSPARNLVASRHA
jgi:nitroimidazol reductase NimA-like FMN-containing flavoprotein (pyridoxamine 5'-phosphate oxidase superfamily)